MDDGFSYAVPDGLEEVGVGAIVRVPLGGRRVRGYVTGVRSGEAGTPLKDIVGVSGDLPVFDGRQLATLRWAAVHYVAPLASLLRAATPPNLPRRQRWTHPGAVTTGTSPLPEFTATILAGEHPRGRYLVGATADDPATVHGLVAPLLVAGKSAAVVLPTFAEAGRLAAELSGALGERVLLASSGLPARQTTAAWVRWATVPGMLLIGTREITLWTMRQASMVLIVAEGRRGMKNSQSPTFHVRDVLKRRAAVERFGLIMVGTVPTAEAVASGFDMVQRPGRSWPLVEILDRSEEPPGDGLIMERARGAIRHARDRDGKVFVHVPHREFAPAFRCAKCGELRRCGECGSGPGRSATCVRCGATNEGCVTCGGRRFQALGAGVGRTVEDLRRSFGADVGPAGSARPIEVGTERDIVAAGPVALAVAVDADRMLLAPHYRAAEDAARVLVRIAGLVARGTGHRCVVQTSLPGHPVYSMLRSGRPLEFMGQIVAERVAAGFPPGGEVIAVEVRDAPAGADADLRAAAEGGAERGVTVYGPADHRDRTRWLLQGRDLHGARIRLRSVAHAWREAGARVRIDADPQDL